MTAELLLSFHVEEHFHAAAFDSPMRRRHWDQCESRVEKNIAKLLDLMTINFYLGGPTVCRSWDDIRNDTDTTP
jgi:hypothetical protein